MARVLAADLVVATHHRERPALAHARLERRQVDLAQRPLVDLHVDGAAVLLLVVGGVVFEAGDGLLGLHALHVGDRHAPRQPWIFAQVVVGAAVERRALDVQGRAEDHVFAARARFVTDRAAVRLGQLDVPRRRERHADGHRGGEVAGPPRRVPRVDSQLLAHALRSVGGPQVRHAQPRDAPRAKLAVRVHETDLLLQREPAQQVLDPRVDGPGGVQIRSGRRARGTLLRDDGRGRERHSSDSRDKRSQAARRDVLTIRHTLSAGCLSIVSVFESVSVSVFEFEFVRG